VVSQWCYTVLVALVGIERLAELVVAKRNLAWSLERGGRESGFGHYPFMVVLHTGLLAGCLVEVWVGDRSFLPGLGWPMLVLVVLAQALRWWCIRTLGHQWNTRIVVVPGLERVTGGPYRHIPHPNYVAVVVEGIALPLVHTAWITALVFTVLNAGLMRIRIRAEDAALQSVYA
jgi:methyltransferase